MPALMTAPEAIDNRYASSTARVPCWRQNAPRGGGVHADIDAQDGRCREAPVGARGGGIQQLKIDDGVGPVIVRQPGAIDRHTRGKRGWEVSAKIAHRWGPVGANAVSVFYIL